MNTFILSCVLGMLAIIGTAIDARLPQPWLWGVWAMLLFGTAVWDISRAIRR